MKILLLASQPERTTRLQMFKGSLKELGYDVVVPKFESRNWIKISGLAEQYIKKEKPDVVHVFNVPDVIYSNTLKKMDKNEYAVGGKVFNYLACGKPVLSSRTISLVRVLGDNLFYYDDKDSFIRETKRLLEIPHDETKYREIAKGFDWEILARKYEEVLRRAI